MKIANVKIPITIANRTTGKCREFFGRAIVAEGGKKLVIVNPNGHMPPDMVDDVANAVFERLTSLLQSSHLT
jgi:hypothetical protein